MPYVHRGPRHQARCRRRLPYHRVFVEGPELRVHALPVDPCDNSTSGCRGAIRLSSRERNKSSCGVTSGVRGFIAKSASFWEGKGRNPAFPARQISRYYKSIHGVGILQAQPIKLTNAPYACERAYSKAEQYCKAQVL